MNSILSNITITVNPKLFVKNPETSDLGKKIIQKSILLMDDIGFENFTFKKLGEQIGSNESSIYRYFESKHKLLLYLSSWYWGWLEYRMVISTTNIPDPMEKLKRAITIVTEKIEDDSSTLHINESILNKIIIAEFTKTLLTKEVDEENKEGYFLVYKRVINRIIDIIQEVNPDYAFAKSLASSIVEGSLHQHFLKDHLKTITNCNENNSPTQFYIDLAQKILSK
ncbi:TetR/AcrR family transcriptional regulator [Flavobacterium cheonhonense]|jgi:AcrR family transcriptional regulator|uniref:TetR/AcrR family transcriptional regulator n=1 Tax=Flavobacterium cheonhonense TaxID=706185 RepID=A0ABP7U7E1_9FLAO|nr:TetR/AcrR family transcriptional regulator [Flavobacterium cheonhonense]PJE42397.1 MAG: TetR family transcriptional regulator [Flavobacterium sp.] [Flavobacterium sp. FEMGT703F]